MTIAGIIAEYNPFHKGHAYHIAKTREITGADYVVVVQSGNFVQRGVPAMVDKHCRAHMALSEGADLVIELPSAYACASAEGFASGGVSLLRSLGCVNALCFGSECGDLSLLSSYAGILAREPKEYQELLRTFLKQGLSFPTARSRAIQEYLSCGQDILPCSLYDHDLQYESEVLSQPNNTLGIEYLKAMLQQDCTMKPYTILRKSAGYHDASMEAELASATAIRASFLERNDFSKIREQLPKEAGQILMTYLEKKQPLILDDFSSVLYYQLLSLSEAELCDYTDVSPELAARTKHLLPQYQNASQFADLLKTKQLTHTRITRALCHILLKEKQTAANRRKANSYPVYGRILGFRRESQPLLSLIKQTASIPLISRMADGMASLQDQPDLLELFEQDVFAAHIYEAVAAMKSKTAICHEFTRQMTVL